MTDQEINIAVATACGWKAYPVPCVPLENWVLENPSGRKWSGFSNKVTAWSANVISDYVNDLNAMHKAEEVIWNNQFHGVNYPHEVFKVTTGMDWKGDMGYFFPTVIRAAARQRAEAFLRTIGKWNP